MAKLSKGQTGDIRGRLMRSAKSTVTGGLMSQDDYNDFLETYLPKEIKADDIETKGSSSSTDVGASPVSDRQKSQTEDNTVKTDESTLSFDGKSSFPIDDIIRDTMEEENDTDEAVAEKLAKEKTKHAFGGISSLVWNIGRSIHPDLIFSFLGDMFKGRESSIRGKMVKENGTIKNDISTIREIIDTADNVKKYRNAIPTEQNEELKAEYYMSLMNSTDRLKNYATELDEAFERLGDESSSWKSGWRDQVEEYRRAANLYVGNAIAGKETPPEMAAYLKPFNRVGLNETLANIESKNDIKIEKRTNRLNTARERVDWLNSIYKVSDEYTKARQNTEFEWLNPKSWYYHMPGTMGSSAASLEAQVTQFATSIGLQYALKKIPQTLVSNGVPVVGTAMTVYGITSAVSNYIARAEETGMEVFDAYKQKVFQGVADEKINGEKLLEEGRAALKGQMGMKTEEMSDEQVLEEMLTFGIQTSDPGFNELLGTSLKGLNQLWDNNMALGLSDMTQSVTVVPMAGKIMSTGSKAIAKGLFNAGSRGVAKVAMKVGAKGTAKAALKTDVYGKVAALPTAIEERAARMLTATTRSIAKNSAKYKYLPTVSQGGARAFVKHIASPAARIGLSTVLEGTEEGQQYVATYDYLRDKYQSPTHSLLSSAWEAPILGLRAWGGLLGIGPDEALNNDHDLKQSMKLGAALSVVMGGAMHVTPIPGINKGMIGNYVDAVAGSKIAQQMTAEHIKAKEDMANLGIYTDGALANRNGRDAYLQYFDDMETFLDPNGAITKEDIAAEKERAAKVFDLIDSPITTKMVKHLGDDYKQGTDNFKTLIGLRIRSAEKAEEAAANYNEAFATYNGNINRAEFDKILDEQNYEKDARQRDVAYSIAKANYELKEMNNFIRAIEGVHETFDEANKKFGKGALQVNKENVEDYLREARKAVAKTEQFLNEYEEGMTYEEKAMINNITFDGFGYDAKESLPTLFMSQIDLVRATQRAQLFNGVPSEEKAKKVKEEIAKFNRVQVENKAINDDLIKKQHDELLGENEVPAEDPKSIDKDPTPEEEAKLTRMNKDSKSDTNINPGIDRTPAKEEVPEKPISEAPVVPKVETEPSIETEEKVAEKAPKRVTEAPIKEKEPETEVKTGTSGFSPRTAEFARVYLDTVLGGMMNKTTPYSLDNIYDNFVNLGWSKNEVKKALDEISAADGFWKKQKYTSTNDKELNKLYRGKIVYYFDADAFARFKREQTTPQTDDVSDIAPPAEGFTGPSARQREKDGLVAKLERDTESLHLTEDGRFYEDDKGNKYARTTSVIGAIPGAERFDPNNPYATPSTTIGTGIDAFIRDFFEGTMSDRPYNMSEEAQAAFIEQLEALAARFRSKGTDIYTNEMTLSGALPVKGKDGMRYINVAGTMDMLGISPKGDVFILDVKTQRTKYKKGSKYEIMRTEKYAKQLSVYKQLLEDKYGIKVKSLHIIPVHVSYPTPSDKNKYTAADGVLFLNEKPYLVTPKLGEIDTITPTEVEIMYEHLTPEEQAICTDVKPVYPEDEFLEASKAGIEKEQEKPTVDFFGSAIFGEIFDDGTVSTGGETSVPESAPNPRISGEAGTGQSDTTGTSNTEEFEEAKKNLLEEQETVDAMRESLGFEEENPVAIPGDKPNNTVTNAEIAIEKALVNLENLPSDKAQNLAPSFGISDDPTDANSGLFAGTVYYQEGSETMFPGYGYSHRSGLSALLADPEGMKGVSIRFLVADKNSSNPMLAEAGARFAKYYDRNNPGTYGSATIYVEIEKGGKKWIAALRTVSSMRKGYSSANKPVNEENIARHAQLMENILNLYRENPNAEIVPQSIKRSNGLFNVNRDKSGNVINRPVKDVKGLGVPAAADKLESDGLRFGIGKGAKGHFYTVGEDQLFLPGRGTAGTVYVYMRNSDTPSGGNVRVKLNSIRFKEDPQLLEYIYEAMMEESPSNILKSIAGKNKGVQITAQELLDFVIHNGPSTIVLPEEADKYGYNIPKQLYSERRKLKDGSTVLIYQVGPNSWSRDYLKSAEGKAAFMEYVGENMHFQAPMVEFWKTVSETFAVEMRENQLDRLNLSKLLNFDKEDIELTALQWQVKHGILLSDLQDDVFKSAFLYLGDPAIKEKPEPANPTVVAEAVKEITPIEDATPEKTSKEDDALYDDYMKSFGFGPEMRVTKTEQTKNKSKKRVNTKQAVRWLNKKLGLTEDQVIVVNGLLKTFANGSVVYGVATKDAIGISTDAVDGVHYHEAWHRVSLLVLTPAQRAKMYADARATYPEYAGLNDKQLEEALAERFRDYMLDRRGLKYILQKMFSPIRTFINKLAGIKPNELTQIFNQIARGDFKNYALDKESVAEFEEAYGGDAYFTVGPNNDFSPKTITELADYYSIVRSLMATAINLNSISTVQNIQNINVDKLKRLIQTIQAKSTNENRRKVLKEVLDNFDTVFYPEMVAELNNIGVRVIDREQEDNTEEEDAAGVQKMSYSDKASFENSKKDNALAGAKFFIASQPVVEFEYIKKDGETVKRIKPYISPLTGMFEVVDFDTSWNTVLTNLHHVNTYDELIEESERLGKTDAFFQNLASRLREVSRKGDTNLETQILQTIKSHKHNMITLRFGKDSETGAEAVSYWEVDTAETDRIAKAYPKGWSRGFYNSKFVKTVNGVATIDRENADELRTKYNELVAKLDAGLTEDGAAEMIAELVKMFNEMGITVNHKTIQSMIGEDPVVVGLTKILKNTSSGSLPNVIHDIVEWEQDKTITTSRGNVIVSLSNMYEFKSNKSFINQLSKHYAQANPNPQELQVLGPNNSLLYPISQHSYISNLVNWLNEKNEDGSPNRHLKEILSATFSKNSIIAKTLSLKGGRIKLNTVTNVRSDMGGDKGRKYTEISPVEDYLVKMALLNEGHLILPTMADKGTYHTITGVKLFSAPLGISTDIDGNTKYSFTKEQIRYFQTLFLDEFNTVVEYWNHKKDGTLEKNPKYTVKNYHTKNFGGLFRHFNGAYKMVGEGPVFSDFNTEIEKAKAKGVEAVLNVLQDIKAYMIDNEENGTAVITDALRLLINKELNTLVNYGVINAETGMYRNSSSARGEMNGLDGRRLKNMKNAMNMQNDALAEHYAILSIVGNHALNGALSVAEIEKVFTGDPAFFNNPEDKIKRLPAVLSTGDNLRTSWPTGHRLHDRSHYTVTEMNDSMIPDAQYDELLELTKKAYKHKNPDLSDEVITAYALKSVAGYGLDKSGKGRMNVTDATVFISPRMYEDLLEMLGEYNDDVKKAFEILNRKSLSWLDDADAYYDALAVVLKPLKMMHFGFEYNSELKIRIPIFDKMALFPMFRIFATGDNYDLYERMNGIGKYSGQEQIDMVKFSSAVKSGSRSPGDFYTDQTNTKISDLSNLAVFKQEFDHLRRQLLTDPHHEERQMLGTQVAKSVLGNLRLNDMYGDMKGSEVGNHVISAMNELSNKGAARIRNMLLNDETGDIDIEKLSEALIKKAKASNMSQELIDGLQVINGRFKVPLSASSDTKWIASSLNSLINDETININPPGGAFIQMTAFATSAITTLKDTAVNRGRRLKLHNEKGAMEAVISINLLKHIIPGYKNMSFTQAKQWLIDNNVIGENANPIAMGYRIPTQGLSSISALQIVDVYPELIGDTIVLPEGFTTLTGSDFD